MQGPIFSCIPSPCLLSSSFSVIWLYPCFWNTLPSIFCMVYFFCIIQVSVQVRPFQTVLTFPTCLPGLCFISLHSTFTSDDLCVSSFTYLDNFNSLLSGLSSFRPCSFPLTILYFSRWSSVFKNVNQIIFQPQLLFSFQCKSSIFSNFSSSPGAIYSHCT